MIGPRRARWLGAVAVAALLGAGALPAEAATPAASSRAVAVQAMLDRILGPGGSYVQVADQISTSSGTRETVRYGAPAVAAVWTGGVLQDGASASSLVQQDAVDRTATTVSTPAGALVRRTVTVLVDRSRLAGIPLRTLRRLISSAAGISAPRGDRLLVVAARLAATPRSAVPTATDPLGWAVPAMWAGGGLLAALLLLLGVRRRRPQVETA